MNAAEDRLSELMDAATRALAPPIETILAEGARLGRRRRRRRRAAVATGTAAVVLLGGIGVATGLRLTHVNHDNHDAAAAVVHHASRAPTTAGPTPSPILTGGVTPTPTPTMQVTPGMEPITSETAVRILKLSGAATWKFLSYDPKNNFAPSLLDVDIDDGNGLARINIIMGTTKNPGMAPADCSRDQLLMQKNGKTPIGSLFSCAVQTYPNGDRVMQEVFPPPGSKAVNYVIIAYRADGIALEITASNGDGLNPATEVTRALPPLSVAQWTAIALDRSWQLEVPFNVAGMTPTP